MTKSPLFHKGHHNIIAAVFRRQLAQRYIDLEADPNNKGIQLEMMVIRQSVLEMSARLARDNPLFDEAKFYDAATSQTPTATHTDKEIKVEG